VGLNAFWSIIDEKDRSALIKRKSVFRTAVPTVGTAGMVEALNRTLTEMSHEIASALQSVER
jgi:hypothetical protein